MAAPQLSVRSSKARDLAHRLARREDRSIAEVVERALEAYEVREAGREPASNFYSRLTAQSGTDIDLEAVLCENRHPHKGVELCFFSIPTSSPRP
ncbi:type II toxin-antitoxin system VapB family antitoxin [Ensifer canadensis]